MRVIPICQEFISILYGYMSTFIIDMILYHIDMSSNYFDMKVCMCES